MTAAEAPWGKNKPVLFASASRWVCRSPDGTAATGRTPGEAWNEWAQTHSVRPYVDYALKGAIAGLRAERRIQALCAGTFIPDEPKPVSPFQPYGKDFDADPESSLGWAAIRRACVASITAWRSAIEPIRAK